MVFWALEQRRKRALEWERELQHRERAQHNWEQVRRQKAVNKVADEVSRALLQTQAETRAETVAELLAASVINPNWAFRRWAQEKDVDLDNLPPV